MNHYYYVKKTINGVVEKLPLRAKLWICYLKSIEYAKKYDSNVKQYIKDNIKWKNRFKGKRCFILGNGPSLKSLDLSKLENEYVFVVNEFSNIKGWEKAKPNFYFSGDLGLGPENEKHDRYLTDILKPYFGHEMACFFHLDSIRLMKKYHLDDELNINYYINGYSAFEYENCRCPIDYSKATISFNSTIPVAISWAIYMGFDKIYLDGIDTDLIYTVFRQIKEGKSVTTWEYAYDSELVKTPPLTIPGYYSNSRPPGFEEGICYREYTRFKTYRMLYVYAKKQGKMIFNGSPFSFVTIFPFVDIEEILGSKVNL